MTDNLVVCSKCGTANRIPPARPALKARCGSCHSELFTGHPEDVTAEIFDRHVGNGTIPVVVDVWAPWCGPCLTMAPAFEAATQQLEPEVRLIKLNSDAEPALSARFGVQAIPTMLMFHGGREIARTSGAMAAGQILRWIRAQLPKAAA